MRKLSGFWDRSLSNLESRPERVSDAEPQEFRAVHRLHLTDFKMTEQNRRRSLNPVLLLHLALVAFLTPMLLHLLAAYWDHFHIGTAPGNGLFLSSVALPGAVVLFGGISAATSVLASRRRWSRSRQALWGAGMLGAAFVSLLVLEVWRTSDYPTESGHPISVWDFVTESP